MSKRIWRKVKQYKLDGTFVQEFPILHAAFRKTGVPVANIHDCANRRQRYAKGFVWRFEDDSYDGNINSKIRTKTSRS